MRHQIIQHKKFCSKKYLFIENQPQDEETMRKVFNLVTNKVFVNVKVRYNF